MGVLSRNTITSDSFKKISDVYSVSVFLPMHSGVPIVRGLGPNLSYTVALSVLKNKIKENIGNLLILSTDLDLNELCQTCEKCIRSEISIVSARAVTLRHESEVYEITMSFQPSYFSLFYVVVKCDLLRNNQKTTD